MGFSEDVHHFFIQSISTEILSIFQMANEWSHISHILEREEEEFQTAMRVEVGVTPHYATGLDKIEFLIYLLTLILLPSMQKMQKSKF